jgi:hypothetical protein
MEIVRTIRQVLTVVVKAVACNEGDYLTRKRVDVLLG